MVVNKNIMRYFIIIISVIINLLLFSNCSTNKELITENCDYYKIYTTKHLVRTVKPTIYGSFYECNTNLPLNYPIIKVNDSVHFKADIKGKFLFSIYPGKYRFAGVGYPYMQLQTKTIKVNPGDSIRIDFYLRLNTTPLVNKR